MADYTPALGDLVEVSMDIDGIRQEVLLDVGTTNPENPDAGEYTLWLQAKEESYLLSDVLEELEGVTIELVKPFAERLPTEPGRYVNLPTFLVELTVVLGGDITDFVGEITDDVIWVLNEDGSWTDAEGETRETQYNWVLATNGLSFVKVD